MHQENQGSLTELNKMKQKNTNKEKGRHVMMSERGVRSKCSIKRKCFPVENFYLI